MVDITASSVQENHSANNSEVNNSEVKKHVKLTEINYQRNTESDYTEKIQELDKNFNYANNSSYYWSKPELSTLYGTPLYEQASDSQKLALNHLYWATQYNQTAATEANAVLYNQVTAGVFGNFSGYETLCRMLDLETDQERDHIHAFHNIGYKTKKALLGKTAFRASTQGRKNAPTMKISPRKGRRTLSSSLQKSTLSSFQDSTFRFITNKIVLKDQSEYYSQYLRNLDGKGEPLPAQTTGLLGQLASRPVLQFFTLNCGSSPFLACLFYLTRFIANMLLKNYEYRFVQYYRELDKKGEFIPTPTAVSFNHLMDEAFHTTTSQMIAQELYKNFPKPTAYEQFVANLTIYRAQSVGLSGLSAALPSVFRTDAAFIDSLYRLLQSSVFGFSSQEALYWLEKCLCQEHEGFHVNLKYHQRLLSDLRRSFTDIDYLWSVNRELEIMNSGGSIGKAIETNSKTFKQFSQSLN
ncbi:hypothetical protein [Mastigocoleus testarum]|uniref:p-aminobenzoate N-oxygenase AurF n=1 Tax=Mastigocoleus testarum BC008 TaxID=371196 RepID=A0A0V7ZDI1_9CYAN|nr:hypothetical protein [Mastigocoleus testarum]KST62479.1 hypothetical protein BC008_09935 [Mastigocoleus testarum BC008]